MFDELGSVSCGGATAKSNSSAYTDSSNVNVHSLYINPTIRHIAGIGRDIFAGTALGSLTAFGGGLDNANTNQVKMSFAEYMIRVFFETGNTARCVDTSGNAHTVDWAPPGAASVAVGAGGALTGTYTYKVTFVTSDGRESDLGTASSTVTPGAQKVDLTNIPTGDSKTAQRYIYRKGVALARYYKVATIADNTTTTYTDNQTDTATLTDGILGAGEADDDEPNTRLGSSATVKYPALFYDRMFWVDQTSGSVNKLIWSKPTNPFAYPAVNYIEVGDAKPVYRIVPFLDDLIIFKSDSIWRLSGSDEDTFSLFKTPANVGTDAPWSIVKLQDRIVFANEHGIWFFDGITARPATNRLDLFFLGQTRNGVAPPVSTASVRYNWDATFSQGRYYLAYADTGTTNNRVIVMDLDGGTISRRSVNALSLSTDPLTQLVYFGDTTGFVKSLDDPSATSDSGSVLTWTFQSKFYDPKRGYNKSFGMIELDINTGGQNITPTAYFDAGASAVVLSTVNTSSRDTVQLAIPSSRARQARNAGIKLTGVLSTVNSSNAPAVVLHGVKFVFDVLKQRSASA